MLAAFDTSFGSAYGTGVSAITSTVPAQFDVAVDGVGYMIDLNQDAQGFRATHFTRKSLPLLRTQADTANTPGEQSLNRDDLWRRTQESWHHGCGQNNFDRANSDSAQFRASKGVNCWNQWQLSLLNDTTLAFASTATNLRLTAAGTHLYLADGQAIRYTPDISTTGFSLVSGTPASTCKWIATDGFTVFAAYGTDGVWFLSGGGPAARFNALPCDLVQYVKGRWMAAYGPNIYNIVDPTAPTPLMTQANPDFQWIGFTEGPGFIYAAGYSGTRSLIYKITVLADGTGLDAPVVAGELPTGETVSSIKGYAGLLLVGTATGIRVGTPDGNGNLTFGPLTPTDHPVLNFEPQDRFVWYGLTNYDSSSTGLGRMDLSVFTDTLSPARASDVMASTQGDVLSISSFGTRRVFTVAGVGVWLESTSKVTTGSLSTGKIAFGLGDDKVAMYVDLRTEPLNGSVGGALSAGNGTPFQMDTFARTGLTRPSSPMNAQQQRAEFFELTLTLTRDPGNALAGPVVTRTTLRCYPAPSRSSEFVMPIILADTVEDRLGSDFHYDILGERQKFEALLSQQQLVTYQEGDSAYTVLVDDLVWIPEKRTADGSTYSGTLVVMLKEMSQ